VIGAGSPTFVPLKVIKLGTLRPDHDTVPQQVKFPQV